MPKQKTDAVKVPPMEAQLEQICGSPETAQKQIQFCGLPAACCQEVTQTSKTEPTYIKIEAYTHTNTYTYIHIYTYSHTYLVG